MKYYKVTDKNQCSLMVAGKFEIYYPLGEWVEPKVGKLFCFNSLKKAKLNICLENRIFECEVRNPQEYRGKILDWRHYEEIENFWKYYEISEFFSLYPFFSFSSSLSSSVSFSSLVKSLESCIVNATSHTILCDSIKLIKEVK